MVVNKHTELRKLRPAELHNLALILSPSENWKKLVNVVPKGGTEDINKFDGETIAILEEASRHERKPAAAIFLEEWATMGRKRPTLGLLLNLLMKAELFRAADYLAEDILKVEAPPRPVFGPAVPIDVEEALMDLLRQQNLETRPAFQDSNLSLLTKSEISLRQIDYPIHILDDETSTSDNNFAGNDVGVIEMRYDQSRSNQVLDHARCFANASETPKRKKNHSNGLEESGSLSEFKSKEPQVSDFMKFSDATDESNQEQNFEGYSRSDLIKFDSEKIDTNRNVEMCEAILPNLDILRSNSSMKNEQISEINERFGEKRDSNDSSVKTDNEAAAIVEMSSTELPAVLEKYGASKYFHRELMSSELPLCINDRDEFHSSESNSSRGNSLTHSLPFLHSSYLESTESSFKNESTDNTISGTGFPCFVLEAATGQAIERQNENAGRCERPSDAFNSQELPVTVLEFQKR